MAKMELKGVCRVRSKGKVYVYAWRGGPRILALEGTPAFVAELERAQASRRIGDASSVASLFTRYLSSDEWKALSDKTRTNWRPWLDRARAKWGTLPIAALERPAFKVAVRTWHRSFKATPRAADMGLQAVSRCMSWSIGEALTSTNPCAGLPRLYSSDRAEIVWDDADMAALRAVASPEVMWAADLAALTGLRQGDLLRLCWTNIGPHALEIRTLKSGGKRKAVVPLYAELRALLERIPRRAVTVLTSSAERPWGTGFGASWQRAITKARVDKHFHDLRGTAATRLFAADFKPREIAGMMGWSEDSVERLLDVYVRRDAMLQDRIRRLDEHASGTPSAKRPAKRSAPKGAK